MMFMGDEISRQERELMSKKNPIKASYKNGACPDCGEPIPKDVQEGDSCCQCGHVFCTERGND